MVNVAGHAECWFMIWARMIFEHGKSACLSHCGRGGVNRAASPPLGAGVWALGTMDGVFDKDAP